MIYAGACTINAFPTHLPVDKEVLKEFCCQAFIAIRKWKLWCFFGRCNLCKSLHAQHNRCFFQWERRSHTLSSQTLFISVFYVDLTWICDTNL